MLSRIKLKLKTGTYVDSGTGNPCDTHGMSTWLPVDNFMQLGCMNMCLKVNRSSWIMKFVLI